MVVLLIYRFRKIRDTFKYFHIVSYFELLIDFMIQQELLYLTLIRLSFKYGPFPTSCMSVAPGLKKKTRMDDLGKSCYLQGVSDLFKKNPLLAKRYYYEGFTVLHNFSTS